jgi:hypothetical protein
VVIRDVSAKPKKKKASTQRREDAKPQRRKKGYTLRNVFTALPLTLRLGDFALSY